MKTSWKRRALALGTFLLFPLTTPDASANGWFARDVVYVAPTDYVAALATSWYVPTVSVVPTYYATSFVPTSYMATSVVIRPTSLAYVPTYYRETYAVVPRVSIFNRRRAFLPTTYVYPSTRVYETVYSSPVATAYLDTMVETASSECCASETVYESAAQEAPCDVPAAETVVTRPSRTETVRTVPRGTPPKTVESGATAPEPVSSVVPTPKKVIPNPAPAPAPAETKPKAVDLDKAADPNTASPPASPAPELDSPSGTPLDVPAEPKVPVAPVEEPPVQIPPKESNGTVYQRDARRPVLTAANAAPYTRSLRDGTLHVLEGVVVSSQTNEPESGVRVTVANRRQTFADRVVVTDASGHYKVRLPDGDWTVSVTTKSGKVYPVSELIVDKGQITDDVGESVPSLTITR